jgi:hypothetical protein
MNWGALDYADPDTQQRMIQQYEKVIDTTHVTEIDTKQLWIADFLVWTSRHCTSNFGRDDPEVFACGHDQVFEKDNTNCAGIWVENIYGLREKLFANDYPDICLPYEEGICRPTRQMHPDDLGDLGVTNSSAKSWCPVFNNWSDEKFGFCLRKWREITGGTGSLIFGNETGTPAACSGEFYTDEDVIVPIPISSSPSMYVYNLVTHEKTLKMLKETRAICDDDPMIHCWLTGMKSYFCLFYFFVMR